MAKKAIQIQSIKPFTVFKKQERRVDKSGKYFAVFAVLVMMYLVHGVFIRDSKLFKEKGNEYDNPPVRLEGFWKRPFGKLLK